MAAPDLAFDSGPISHFAIVGRLEVLKSVVQGHRCVITRAVHQELETGSEQFPAIREALSSGWLEVVRVDGLEEIYALARYLNLLGSAERNAGEASVLAWAECHGATAYVDDQAACHAGRNAGVKVYRTLGLLVDAARSNLIPETEAQAIVRELADSGYRLPDESVHDLFGWARFHDLL